MVVLIAVLAAVAAGWMALGMMRPAPVKVVVKKEVDTTKVLVTKTAIGFGDAVRASDFTWQPWPKDAPLDGYITEASKPNAASEYAGSIARTSFLPGEPVKPAKLAKPGQGGVMAAILPAGKRAVSTKISEETAAGNFILPGDFVDVLVTRKQRSSNGRGETQVSDTLFRNIRVLAIGQELDQKDGKKAISGKTATLELNANQAEQLALNNTVGEVSLSLRSLEDSSKAKNENPADDDAKKKPSAGIKVLRYGNWSRSFGLQ